MVPCEDEGAKTIVVDSYRLGRELVKFVERVIERGMTTTAADGVGGALATREPAGLHGASGSAEAVGSTCFGEAKVEHIEIRLVNIEAPVRRSDAIQSFVVQETPIVQIYADDGSEGRAMLSRSERVGSAIVEMISSVSRAGNPWEGPGKRHPKKSGSTFNVIPTQP